MLMAQPQPVPAAMDYAAAGDRATSGLLCSTSGTVLHDRDQLRDHYSSDLHRYNLKRKVAGLPPVTREWFEARKAQLAQAHAAGAAQAVPAGHVRVWWDPLTRKTFRNEATYQNHIRSNKYQELVRRSGQPAPEPVISIRKISEVAEEQQAAAAGNKAAPTPAQQQQSAVGFKVVQPSGGLPLRKEENDKAPAGPVAAQEAVAAIAEESEDEDGSGWETASDVEEGDTAAAPAAATRGRSAQAQQQQAAAAAQEEGEEEQQEEWVEWDVKRSLFDNHISKSFEANLEYMFRNFGFYLPDAEYLKDPEGLVKYLGAKLQYGHVPLYTRGDDPNAKTFRSLHAVQRHMVDSGRCRMVYEDNEEEYGDYYEYEDEQEDGQGKELVAAGNDGPAPAVVISGYELLVPGASGSGGKILGTREFARYYRQRHRLPDERQIVVVNTMLARYRSLGISLRDEASSLEAKKLKSKSAADYKWASKRNMGQDMRGNIIKNLPKNCPY